MVSTVFGFLARDGVIREDWFAGQVAYADRTDGDIDTLANRIAHIRTWTFAANRPQWLADPRHWQEQTRAIEDRLSDALHERLTGRFVDRRTSVLMRRLKENAMLEAEITPTGDVLVEGQHVGTLQGFRFLPDQSADGPDAKALRAAAQKALAGEFARRAEAAAGAANTDLVLSTDGTLRWQGAAIAKIIEGDDALRPRLVLLADESLASPARDRVQARVDLWLANHADTLLKPLFDLRAAEQLTAAARGIAFRLAENFGAIDRAEIAEEVRSLDQDARAGLRTLGVRFGAYHLYVPQLLKPAPSGLLASLWALKNGGLDQAGLSELSGLAASGRTSLPVEPAFPRPLYRIVGYRIAGTRAVRIDILERLADLIRPLIAWRPTPDAPTPPDGAAPGNGFTVTVSMTSLLGCSGEDFASVLRGLGYRVERRPAPEPVAEPVAQPAEADAAGAAAPIEDVATSPPAETPDTASETAPEGEAETQPVIAVDAEPQPVGAVDTVAVEPVAAAAEPAFIEIWRPGRGNRPKHERRTEVRDAHDRRSAPPSAAPQARAPNGATRPEGDRRRDRPPRKTGDGRRDAPRKPPQAPRPDNQRREKQADPDSPFAALAALKAQLEGKGDGN